MRQSGTFTLGTSTTPVPPEGSLVVDAASANGSQVWHRSVDRSKPPSDTTFTFGPTGMFIVSTVQRTTVGAQTVTFTCTFNPGIPAPPWPPKVGTSFSGHGSCGSFTADVTGKITGTHTVVLDGAQVPTYVVASTIVTHGQVESTITQTDWFAPSLRLSVHNQSQSKGTYGVFSFSSNTTSDLVSGRPS
jgi:hypothetical protein